jgi:hypothetical protein
MTAITDHYSALGIDPTADQEVIAAAYRALAKKYHPDTGATTGTASPERFAEIQQAYEVLGSAEGRRRYDAELLEATQRELDEHLARKQRKIAGTAGVPPPPPPDLGGIRPHRPMPKPGKGGLRVSLREMGPFLVVSGLLMAVAVGFASLFFSHNPLPPVEEPRMETAQAPKTAPRTQPPPEARPVAQAEPVAEPRPTATPSPPPQEQAALPEQTPLFGTSMMDQAAETITQPAAEDVAAAFGRQATPASAPLAVPVPKAKPQAVPEEDATAVAQMRGGRYTVVIYEKYRTGDILQEEARVVFATEDRCAAFGERAVLRRLAPYEGQRLRPRIWYECQQAP